MERVGLIAGNGRFPLLMAARARELGLGVVAVAHRGETAPELADLVEAIFWVEVGQLDRIITILKTEQIRRVVLVGGVKKVRLFSGARPDMRMLRLLARVGIPEDDAVLRAVTEELEREGLEVQPLTVFLAALLASAGLLVGPPLSPEEEADVVFGWERAKAVGALEIGQCVVVKRGVVLAVEAVEGTDEAIRRGGALASGGAVVVKVIKPHQDERLDLPTVGPGTLKTMASVGARVLAVEAGKTLLLDRDQLLAMAAEAGISILGVSGGVAGRPTR